MHLFASFIMRAFMALIRDWIFVDGIRRTVDVVYLDEKNAFIKQRNVGMSNTRLKEIDKMEEKIDGDRCTIKIISFRQWSVRASLVCGSISSLLIILGSWWRACTCIIWSFGRFVRIVQPLICILYWAGVRLYRLYSNLLYD